MASNFMGCKPQKVLAFTFLVAALFGLSSAVLETNGKSRFVRSPSPGLFGGLPSPGDLADKLKPITIADLNALKDQIKGLNGLSARFDQVIAAEKQARNALQNLYETTKEKISNLENALNPDELNFWKESESCGGVIVSQTGKISFKKNSYYEGYERCLWTIRVNFRSRVKLHVASGLSSTEDTGFDFLTVTEIPSDDNNGSLHTETLENGKKYIFKGPILLVSFLTDGTNNDQGFVLEFEGVGGNINTNTIFQHFHLDNWADSFSSENVTNANTNQPFPSTNPLSRSKRMFSTIVINPQYKNVTQLQLKIEESSVNLMPENCERSALNLYEDFKDSNSAVKRCCGTKCEDSEFKNNDGIFLATFLSDIKSPSSFKFAWEIDTAIPSEDSINTCGGALSGRVGRISYKVDEEYASNERCVWMIIPTGKSKVKITLLTEELEQGYDQILVTSIGQDFSLDAEPQNTILQKSKSYNFSGPVIFITFYSDGAAEGKGFELVFEDVGSNLHEGSSVSQALPLILNEESGTQSLNLYAPVLQVAVINPRYLDGSALHLTLAKLNADFGTKCGSDGLRIYGSDHGNFSVAKWFCENQEGGYPSEDFQTIDGVFILVYYNTKSVGDIEFTWKKGPSPKESVVEGEIVVEQTEGCGGILIGDSGRIDYKLTTAYENYERCTWVIQSSRKSKITLRLLKDGFESCCDSLILSPLNPENGTVSKNYAMINREHKFKSFTAPIVFVTFYSDSSVGDHGFSLEFTTSGDLIENPYKYKHEHLSNVKGSISVPSENELLPLKNEIQIFVFSPDAVPGNMDTNVTISVKNLGVDDKCQMDSLGIFELPISSTSLTKRYACSGENHTSCECVTNSSDLSEDLTIANRAFVAVIKSVESSETKSFNFKWITTGDTLNAANDTTSTQSPN